MACPQLSHCERASRSGRPSGMRIAIAPRKLPMTGAASSMTTTGIMKRTVEDRRAGEPQDGQKHRAVLWTQPCDPLRGTYGARRSRQAGHRSERQAPRLRACAQARVARRARAADTSTLLSPERPRHLERVVAAAYSAAACQGDAIRECPSPKPFRANPFISQAL